MKFKMPPIPEPPVADDDIKVTKTEQIIKSNLRFENIPWYSFVQVNEYDAEPPWAGGKCVTMCGSDSNTWGYGAITIPVSILKQIVEEYETP